MLLALLLAAEPAALTEPQNIDGYRVTLMKLSELSPSDLITKDGHPAAGGRRIWWLVEPKEGSREPPPVGAVRLTVGGKPYQSTQPDVAVRDYTDAAGLLPTPQLPPRPGAIVAEVIVRGRALPEGTPLVAELQLRGKKPVWVRARSY